MTKKNDAISGSAASLRVAVDCTSIEQVLALLAFTDSLGLTPKLGPGGQPPGPLPRANASAAKAKTKAKPGAKSKPKRYPPSLVVRLVEPPPKDAPPKLKAAYRKIHKRFGDEPFEKGAARQLLKTSQPLTNMLDRGYAAPAT